MPVARWSFLGLRGLRSNTSASGFSYAMAMAAAQSVKQQMMIMKKEGRGSGEHAEDDACEDGPELGEGSGGEEVAYCLLKVFWES